MLAALRRHPLPIQAFFRHSLVLTYAYPEELLRPLLPPGLTLDTYEGSGFLAIALVQTEALRPVGLPALLGRDFFLSGYRIFSRYRRADGKTLRGLRILRSDTDSRLMVWGGNRLTHYRYRKCPVDSRRTAETLEICITTPNAEADLSVRAMVATAATDPPPGSPFPDLKVARRYAGPLPFTFDYEAESQQMVIVEGVRVELDPQAGLRRGRPVHVSRAVPFQCSASALGECLLHRAGTVSLAAWRRRSRLSGTGMSPYAGVLKIARFNWPWYAAAVAVTGIGALLLGSGALTGAWALLGLAGLLAASCWVLISLAVSYYVYDRSPVWRGAWLDGVNPAPVRRAAIFHAGQDEASAAVARAMPSAQIQAFDFHDPARNGTPSLERARALADRHAAVIAVDKVPLNDGTRDLALVVFAAHEIRRDGDRAALFRELARALAPTGRVLIVEHLRDGWNFLAYGPGALHFLSRETWQRSFADGGLQILRETPCTSFVRVFELGRPA